MKFTTPNDRRADPVRCALRGRVRSISPASAPSREIIANDRCWREADIRQNTDYQQELRLPGVAQRELSCEVCHAGVESHKAMLVGRPPIPKETSGCSHDDRRCPLIALGGSERD